MNAMTRRFNPADINVENFAEAYPAEYEWISTNAPKFDFAFSLLTGIAKYGSLTERQLAAVHNCMKKAKEREEAKANPKPTLTVNTDALNAAFDRATANGLKRPKMRFEGFSVTMAPAAGKNPGALYVKSGEDYLGKVVAGQFYAARDCDPAIQQRVVDTMQNPTAAAIAYARKTGNCSICGAQLTNGVSIERGIGPICASKFGL